MQHIVNAGYQHARQSCYLCLQPHDGVDTEVQIDYEGVLFLCKGCCRALALTAGFLVNEDQTDKVDALKESLAFQTERADLAESELAQLALYRERNKNLAKARAAKASA